HEFLGLATFLWTGRIRQRRLVQRAARRGGGDHRSGLGAVVEPASAGAGDPDHARRRSLRGDGGRSADRPGGAGRAALLRRVAGAGELRPRRGGRPAVPRAAGAPLRSLLLLRHTPRPLRCAVPAARSDSRGTGRGRWSPRGGAAAPPWSASAGPGGRALGVGGRPMVLGTITGQIHRMPPPGEELVVMAWAISSQGRKHTAGTALYTGSEVLAQARSVWIAVDPAAIRPA